MATYAHRPDATGMHAKLVAEARELSPYWIAARYGIANHVNVIDGNLFIVWHGHRDLLPQQYRFAHDPTGALTSRKRLRSYPVPLTISIPDELIDTAARVLESLTGFHVRISFTSPNGPWLDMDTVEIAGLTPDGDLITRDVLDGFTGLGTSTFDVETIRRVTVI